MEPRIKIFEMIRKSREIERRERVGGEERGRQVRKERKK